MQATRGKTTRVSQDIEQQNMTVPAKRRTGLSADIAEVHILLNFPSLTHSAAELPLALFVLPSVGYVPEGRM